jgi:hypothetical protein
LVQPVALPDDVQNELRTHALLLERFGPQLGKDGVGLVAFAF